MVAPEITGLCLRDGTSIEEVVIVDDGLVAPQKDHGVGRRLVTQRDRRHRLKVELHLMVRSAKRGNGDPAPASAYGPVNMPVEYVADIAAAGDDFTEKMSVAYSQIILGRHPDIEGRMVHKNINRFVAGAG